MNPNLKSFYAAIHENKAEIFDTNLKLFVEKLNDTHKSSRNYDWFYREFKKADYFKADLDGKEFAFQKLV